MTKTIKMSMIAALTITSLNAQALTDAIKGVEVSGKMEVEYDYTESRANNAAASTTRNDTNGYDLDLDLTLKSKITDTITAVVGIQADVAENNEDETKISNGNVDVSKTYFQYADGTYTALVGRQSVGTPFFDDERADGIVGLATFSGVTVAAAHFNNINSAAADSALGSYTINAQAIIGAAGPVNYSLWTAQVLNLAKAYSADVNGKFGDVTVDLRHTDVDYEDTDNDAKLTKIVASMPVGDVTLIAGYGTSGKHNADSTAGVDLTGSVTGGTAYGDNDADSNFAVETFNMDDYNDAKAYLVGVSANVAGSTLTLVHAAGDYASTTTRKDDFKETKLSASYPLASNLKITGHYAAATVDSSATVSTDYKNAAVAIEYKF